MNHFMTGFTKRSFVIPSRYIGGAAGAVGGAMTGMGVGLLTRSKLDQKFVEDKDKTFAHRLVEKAPHLGALFGLLGGYLHGVHRGPKVFGLADTIYDTYSTLRKTSALKSDVDLKPHQERAIKQLIQNDGSLLVAHATGSGKTLTGIAGFEELKKTGKAKAAIVVVPASLRQNFVENLKKFTNSTFAVYGPKNEASTKNIGDRSGATYNIISYELFREHGEQLIQDVGADTLIMDEIHRVRGIEGTTYNKIRELRPKFKNALTLTGSIVNNEPNDVVPLMDITYGPTGHKLVSKQFFDKLFVNKNAVTKGFLFPKVHINKSLKNKAQLGQYLRGKIDFVPHEELEKDMPKKTVETVTVPMSAQQKTLYDFTLSSVDPITRWKIKNNLPVTQREAKDAFGKLMQARQVSTDPAVMDKQLQSKDPHEYSNKVNAVITDTIKHIEEKPTNRTVIFGNLITGQLNAIEKSLKAKGVDYAKFVGMGQEGSTVKQRDQAVRDFNSNKTRVLLISGAGAEGLDLKGATMMQMLEGHYNPERIQQAESRIRRLGSTVGEVMVKRYLSKPEPTTGPQRALQKVYRAFGASGGDQGVDKWIYTIAENKDRLNSEFRDVLKKQAGESDAGLSTYLGLLGHELAILPAAFAANKIESHGDKHIEATLKQMLLDRGREELTKKQHYDKILAESKLDERVLDAKAGIALASLGLPFLLKLHPKFKQLISSKIVTPAVKAIAKMTGKSERMPRGILGMAVEHGPAVATGMVIGATIPIAGALVRNRILTNAIGGSKDLDKGIEIYTEKLRKKMHRKYKTSKGFVQEFETKKELGVDVI